MRKWELILLKEKKIPKDCNVDPKFIDIINQMLSYRPDERPIAKDLLKESIINVRIEVYLKVNGFNLESSELVIKKYEDNKKKELEKK